MVMPLPPFRDHARAILARLRLPVSPGGAPSAGLLVLGLVCVVAAAGCESTRSVKVDNPVLGPPPPRIRLNESEAAPPDPQAAAARADHDDVSGMVMLQDTGDSGRRASSRTDEGPHHDDAVRPIQALTPGVLNQLDLTGHEVVALVNGNPIFVSEILDYYSRNLEQLRREAPPEQYIRLRNQLLKRDLPQVIETRLLVDLFKQRLKPEQLEHVRGILINEFEKEIARLQKEMDAKSRAELMRKLEEQGTTLDALQETFINRHLATEYLRSQTKFRTHFPREELLAYYREHIDEFRIEGRVRWQQIVIDFEKHGGREGAWDVFRKVAEALRAGEDFGDVARQYSDGATAAKGGLWDWTRQGSLSNKDVEKALFELPVGTVSQEFISDKNIQIVRVLERIEPSVRPFEEVQDEIRKKLMDEHRRQALQAKLEELKAQADIVTIFDDLQAGS
ncbi:MAG: hypothetical protein D6725_14310 [Planctomycetota bacterium]|nr:MAG: hypothetical protein D6725_14310 [Planctomycetota bacterium]